MVIFNHAVYGTFLPKMLIKKALNNLRLERLPIASLKHQISIDDRAYAQLLFLSLAIPMAKIEELSLAQQQAYALGKLYSYAFWQADRFSTSHNHSIRKLWGQINRNPKQALLRLSKIFRTMVVAAKEEAIFSSLYQSVMEISWEIPEQVDLDYGIAFMWGIAVTSPKLLDEAVEQAPVKLVLQQTIRKSRDEDD